MAKERAHRTYISYRYEQKDRFNDAERRIRRFIFVCSFRDFRHAYSATNKTLKKNRGQFARTLHPRKYDTFANGDETTVVVYVKYYLCKYVVVRDRCIRV